MDESPHLPGNNIDGQCYWCGNEVDDNCDICGEECCSGCLWLCSVCDQEVCPDCVGDIIKSVCCKCLEKKGEK